MSNFEVLSNEVIEKLNHASETGDYPKVAFSNKNAVYRHTQNESPALSWKPTFVQDIEKIMNCPYYNRYTDKTQVFSLYKNDDITRRSLHVQLVSRISRTIGAALHLNLDLIEAIALGHDIGHPPFAHTGESYLDKLHFKHTGRHFYHNVQSVRVLDGVFPHNISLQTLDGIVTHNGEFECEEYRPAPLSGFEEFDKMVERCYTDSAFAMGIMPSTLEGAVVRISDIIAYIGKDRQDAVIADIVTPDAFTSREIGTTNAEIMNNLIVNVIENSYGKPYIKLDTEHFEALRKAKIENYKLIYNNAAANARLDITVKPMMEEIYGQLLDDLRNGKKTSPIFDHHIDYVNHTHGHRDIPYESGEPHQIVVDYIASMTDDYLVELHGFMYPGSPLSVMYKGYFDEESKIRKD